MKPTAFAIFLALLLFVLPTQFAAAAGSPKPLLPTQASAVLLADQVVKSLTPVLTQDQKAALESVTAKLDSKVRIPVLKGEALDDLVNTCTIALANTDGIEAVAVTAAYAVKVAPTNPRVINLFGVALHVLGRNTDAIAVLEYARSLNPKSELILLNAANIYLDLDRDATAKAYADKVIALDGKNKAAWSLLATYWYKKGDMKQALNALTKAAVLGGGVVGRKSVEQLDATEKQTVTATDSIETMEQKLARLSSLKPYTTADLIEDQYPTEAKQIRDHALQLALDDRMVMPHLPQMNVSGCKAFRERGSPYLEVWRKAFGQNAKRGMEEIQYIQAGIKPTDSKQVKQKKAVVAANSQVRKSLSDAEKLVARLSSMPGMTPARIAKIKADLKKAEQRANTKLDTALAKVGASPTADTSSDDSGQIKSDEDAAKVGAEYVPPGYDYGSPFAIANYRAYLAKRVSYEFYMRAYFIKYQADVADILKVYNAKVQEVEDLHKTNVGIIDKEEDAAAQRGEPDSSKYLIERRQEMIKYKRGINNLSDHYFALWQTLAFPQYESKMKPMLEAFWSTCAVYIQNMNQRDVLKAEYVRCKQDYWQYAATAVNMMSAGNFTYFSETDEEEQQLNIDIATAKEDAEQKSAEYSEEMKIADSVYVKWLEDNFALGLAGEFLSVKVTPRQVTVEEYIAGMNFKHIYDFKTGNWTTVRSFAAKIDVGIQVGPMKAGVSARADILESYDTYNVQSGKLVDCGSSFAKGDASGTIGAGDLSVKGNVNVTLDPAAQSELAAKFTSSIGYKDKEWSSD